MKNKVTTISGILLIAGAVLTAAGSFLAGDAPDFSSVLAAIAGAGFLKAADGGL